MDGVSPNYHRRLDEVLKVQPRLESEQVYEKMKGALGIAPFLSYLILSKEEANENRYIYLDMVEDVKILYDRADFFAERLKKMKERLSEERASSFYGERSYGKEEAEEAYHGALFVLNAVKEMLKR